MHKKIFSVVLLSLFCMNQDSVAGTLEEFIQQNHDNIQQAIQIFKERAQVELKRSKQEEKRFQENAEREKKEKCRFLSKKLIEFLAFEKFVAEKGIAESYVEYGWQRDSKALFIQVDGHLINWEFIDLQLCKTDCNKLKNMLIKTKMHLYEELEKNQCFDEK